MILKIDKEIEQRFISQDNTITKRVLDEYDKLLIKSLKTDKNDTRYIQGYSAAIDDLLAKINKQ